MYSPCSYPAHGTRAPDGCVFIAHYNIHSGHCSDLHQYRRVEKFYSEILQIIRVDEESKQTLQTGADVFFRPINPLTRRLDICMLQHELSQVQR